MKSGHSKSELQGAPWIDSNIDGMAKIVKKPSVKDDFYLSVNYEDFQNDNPGCFSNSQYDANQRLSNILYNSGSIANGALISRTRTLMSGGDSSTLVNYLMSNDAYDVLSTAQGFFGNCGIYRFYKNDNETFYRVEFNTGANGLYGIQTPAYYALATGNQNYTSYAINLACVILQSLDMDYSSAYNIANYGIQLYQDVIYTGYNSQGSGFNTTISSLSANYPYLASALTSAGLSSSSRVYLSGLDVAFFNRFYALLDYSSTYDYVQSYVLTVMAFELRHLVGINKYKTISQYLAQFGYPDEYDLSNYDSNSCAAYMTMAFIPTLIDKAYIKLVGSESRKNQIATLIESILGEYKNMINANTWLSSTGKSKIVTKLENMGYTSCYSDKVKNFPALPESNLNSLTLFTIWNYYNAAKLSAAVAGTLEINPLLSGQSHPYTVNAFYSPSSNQFVILEGLLSGGFVGSDTETTYARVGVVIGHEISHAFDANGSYYNEYGEYNQNGWWPSSDMNAFNTRVQKIVTFFNKIKLTSSKYADGSNVNTEATADMGGMSVMLRLAKKINNFDYDKFFKAYVTMWREVYQDYYLDSMMQDVHPFAYLRGNVTVAQFDEFVNTYNIQKGDGMYVPKSERIAIW